MANITGTWGAPGNLGSYGFKAPTVSGVALTVWESTSFGINPTEQGIRLYAGGTDGLAHEYGYDFRTNVWAEGCAFPGTNGYGGVGGQIIGKGLNRTILHLTNQDNKLEIWWRDWAVRNSSFPSGSWNRGNANWLLRSHPIEGNQC